MFYEANRDLCELSSCFLIVLILKLVEPKKDILDVSSRQHNIFFFLSGSLPACVITLPVTCNNPSRVLPAYVENSSLLIFIFVLIVILIYSSHFNLHRSCTGAVWSSGGGVFFWKRQMCSFLLHYFLLHRNIADAVHENNFRYLLFARVYLTPLSETDISVKNTRTKTEETTWRLVILTRLKPMVYKAIIKQV